ncbi:hypothetical protein SLE2022_224350 [Rubroshorea leprosula]
MNILSWNYQGLGQALTRRALNDLIFKYRPCLVFLMETKKPRRYLEPLRRKFAFSSSAYVEPQGYSGGLALWWTEDINLSIFYSDKNMFDGCCSDAAFTTSWHFSLVYGEPNVQLRRNVWNKVLNMGRPESIPWLLMGDLNLVEDSSDKKGKRPPLVTDKRILEDLICSCLLRDVTYKGPQYTWSRGHI